MLRACSKCVSVVWFGVMSVSGIGAKPAELPRPPRSSIQSAAVPRGSNARTAARRLRPPNLKTPNNDVMPAKSNN